MAEYGPILDADVIVVLYEDGEIVNGNGNVLKGKGSLLGQAVLGYMVLEGD